MTAQKGSGQVLPGGHGETVAESVTHVVLGVDTSAFSDADVLEWADDDVDRDDGLDLECAGDE